MFAHLCAPPSAMRRQRRRSINTLRAVGIVTLGLLGTVCAVTTRPIAGADPSDPDVRVPAVAYRSVVGGYVSRRPVAPAPWREQNERITPPTKQ
jgi:hypothetical protein